MKTIPEVAAIVHQAVSNFRRTAFGVDTVPWNPEDKTSLSTMLLTTEMVQELWDKVARGEEISPDNNLDHHVFIAVTLAVLAAEGHIDASKAMLVPGEPEDS